MKEKKNEMHFQMNHGNVLEGHSLTDSLLLGFLKQDRMHRIIAHIANKTDLH